MRKKINMPQGLKEIGDELEKINNILERMIPQHPSPAGPSVWEVMRKLTKQIDILYTHTQIIYDELFDEPIEDKNDDDDYPFII